MSEPKAAAGPARIDADTVTPSEWDLLMRLDDVLPKGHPHHRLVIEVGSALIRARYGSQRTKPKTAADRILLAWLTKGSPRDEAPWADHGLAALDHLDALYYAEGGGMTVADYRAATDAIRTALSYFADFDKP